MGLTVIKHTSDRRPHFLCLVCGEAAFARDELSAYERHVVKCAERHETQLRMKSMRHRSPLLFDPQNTEGRDVEHEAWVKDRRVEIIEGRKTL